MNFFYNFKMVYKILTLVVIAAIGMALIGYRGYSTISESRDSLEIIYQKNMQQLYCIGEIKY
ncbi:MAG: MCP four helix bundle domain-containing protein, partial [Anaerovibrio sp.]|nr:MCP four helix bundle domain-containing protein [Anaerovibrio sp.]